MFLIYFLVVIATIVGTISLDNDIKIDSSEISTTEMDSSSSSPVPCTCGIFMDGQFKKGSKQPPKGNPALLQEMDSPFINNAVGNRQCMNKCLELIVKHLTKSADIICGTLDRDCHKEKAYLFIKNYDSKWQNTHLSAGREFCCKDNESYKCN